MEAIINTLTDMADMNVRKKKLLHKSIYRGSKETDMLIGSFAKMYIPTMGEEEMDMWENILDAEDALIYQWLILNKSRPELCNNSMGDKLKDFVKNR